MFNNLEGIGRMKNSGFEDSDFVQNPTPRLPVVLCLDVSGSMELSADENNIFGDRKIDRLNQGLRQFFDEVNNDPKASLSAEISIITFGTVPKVIMDFSTIKGKMAPTLEIDGATSMGAAVQQALMLLRRRKSEYKNSGIEYYQPWLVLMTDGQPTDDITMAATETSNMVKNRKLTVFPIMIGDDAYKNTIARFSPRAVPLRLKNANFKSFFTWLSKSISNVSRSTPGEIVALPPVSDWRELSV